MTLGQRIQEERKKLNLSQEALGESMGVSRQAISKWESDLTIPEIDKLVALSKLFGISVGELLGVEEGGQSENGESPSPTRDWTDQDRAQVENVVVRYLRAAEQRDHQGKRWLVLGACLEVALALIVAFVLVRAFDRMDSLNREIANLSSHINSVEHSISYQYSYFNEQMAALGQQTSLVEEYDYTLLGVNKKSGLCQLEVVITPKVYEEYTYAQLTLTPEGKIPVTVQGEWTGQSFQFRGDIQAADEVGVLFSVSKNGTQQTETLAAIGDLASQTQLGVEMHSNGGSTWVNAYNRRDKLLLKHELIFDVTSRKLVAGAAVNPEKLELILEHNGEVFETQKVALEQFINDSGRWYKELTWEKEITMAEGDSWLLRYCMKDSLGQTYEQDIFHFVLESRNGRITPVDQPLSTPAVTY